MEGVHTIATGGAPSPTVRPGTGGSYKRKRSGAEFESSPGSAIEGEEEEHEHEHEQDRRRQPGVKRACNECRQQKLRCDVVQDPFTTCSRCHRLKLECKIESNFKRVGKRSKHAEMEKQIDRLQRCLQRAKAAGFQIDDEAEMEPSMKNGMFPGNNQSFMGSEEAVSSLLHLKQGGSYPILQTTKSLGNVSLTEDTINQLFGRFWVFYHPFLPFLDEQQSPEQYFQQSQLLFWVIITIASRRYEADLTLLNQLTPHLTALLWKTVGEVPNNHYIVKALCLICIWPLPCSTTTTDPTHIICGVMMKAATGIGLHRPNHTQDFSRVSVDLSREQLHDRVTTWAVCNIVAQSVGTGYGQPASTLYDWTLAVRPGDDSPFTLSPELEARLQIERLCDKISKEMYSNASDPRGIEGDETRAMLTRVYRREYMELQASLLSRTDVSPFVELHLKAAGLHLRLSAFFDSSSTKGYMDDLMGLWRATVAFLDYLFVLDPPPHGDAPRPVLRFATNYILQMSLAACFSLLKLLSSSFFARTVDFSRGRTLFHRTIEGIRAMCILQNDLPWRLAELMVQLWNSARVEARAQAAEMGDGESNPIGPRTAIDDSLQLKVRCRMSMSLVFDSIWRWREEFQAPGRGTLEAKIPTNPDSENDSSAASSHLNETLIPQSSHQLNNQLLPGGRGVTPNSNGLPSSHMGLNNGIGYMESNYEVFDPLNWMLDGLVDFPYSFHAIQGLEANQMSS